MIDYGNNSLELSQSELDLNPNPLQDKAVHANFFTGDLICWNMNVYLVKKNTQKDGSVLGIVQKTAAVVQQSVPVKNQDSRK